MSGDADLKQVPEQVLQQSTIFAMKALSGHIETLGGTVAELRADMKDHTKEMRVIHDKVLIIEAAELKLQVTGLSERVGVLETEKAGSRGARSFATEVREWVPTIIGLLALAAFYFKHT